MRQEKNMKLSDFKPEIDAIRAEGYELSFDPICKDNQPGLIQMDYGETLVLIAKKNDQLWKFSLVECYYDTDSHGNKTKWHGVLDIRDTPWSKKLRGLAT